MCACERVRAGTVCLQECVCVSRTEGLCVSFERMYVWKKRDREIVCGGQSVQSEQKCVGVSVCDCVSIPVCVSVSAFRKTSLGMPAVPGSSV